MSHDWNRTIIDEFRANGGKVGGQSGRRRSCCPYTVEFPAGGTCSKYQAIGGSFVVFAVQGRRAGANLVWYYGPDRRIPR